MKFKDEEKPFLMRIPFFQREKACYLILRRKGLSINQIAFFSGRSTSVIARAITILEQRGVLHHFDMRKLPYNVRMRLSSFRWATLMKLKEMWESWLLCECEKPP